MPDQDTVLWSCEDGVATLTLNRPDSLNALTPEMEERWTELLERAAEDPDVRAIVVTGAGRGFCAGADMNFMDDMTSGRIDATGNGSDPTFVGARPHVAATIPKPVIAAINGACAGLGLVHALFCDVRFAADDAKITTAFVRRGLIAEYGISWVLPKVAGLSTALDLLVSGRVILGEEAHRLRLVDHVYPRERVLEEAQRYARELAQFCAPRSIATMKQQVYRDILSELEPAVQHAEELMRESIVGPDFAEGIQSYIEKRPPRFPAFVAGA
ncbi:MAG: enoyl-CoA hydratase/isomerase family protein [Thermoleophilaceae bacterium]|nr:enoyl-CoA hydratase/isomerase family protein [Thermoleophilaceae bacterium]